MYHKRMPRFSVDTEKLKETTLKYCNKYNYYILAFNLVVYSYLTTPEFGVLFTVGILIHEGGHYFVQKYYGYDPKFYVFPLVMAGVEESIKDSDSDEYLVNNQIQSEVYLAGTATSIIFLLLLIPLYFVFNSYSIALVILIFSLDNVLNLNPFFKLFDGGKSLNSIKRLWNKEKKDSAIIVATTHSTLAVAYAMVIYISLQFIEPSSNLVNLIHILT